MKRIVRIWKYEFYLWEFLAVFFTFLMMENIFSWLVFPVSKVLLMYEKSLSIVIYAFVIYKFRNLKLAEKIYILVFTALMVKMSFESMWNYGTFFQEFTMYTILFPVIFTIYIKAVCRSLQLDFLPFLAQFYLYLYIVFMVIYGRGFSFSLADIVMDDYGPFSGDTRIIHARSIFMMIIPLLYYFTRFLNGHYKSFIPFAFCFVVILIHQHRSVWASTTFALAVYLFASYRNKYVNFVQVFKISVTTIVLLIGVWFVVSSTAPKLIDLFTERSSEILNPNREGGTGEFRAQQRIVYAALAMQRPIFGWTFEGFEMPNPLVDWWPAKTGQHFHEGYMEMFFYEGITGLLLKYSFLLYLLVKAFSKKLSQESVVLIAFCLAGFIFSFSYVLPLVFWGVVGVTLYYLEKKPDEEEYDDAEMVYDETDGEYKLLDNDAEAHENLSLNF